MTGARDELVLRLRGTVAALRQANAALRGRAADAERTVAAYDRLTDIVLRGGGVPEVVTAAGDRLGGVLAVFDESGTPVAWSPGTPEDVLREMRAAADDDAGAAGDGTGGGADGGAGGAAGDRAGGGAGGGHHGAYRVTGLVAGGEELGTLVWAAPPDADDPGGRLLGRTAAMVALLRLFRGELAAAEAKARGELLDDLLTPGPRTHSSAAERAARIGYRPGKRHAVIVARVRPERRRYLASVAADLAAARDGLSTVRDGQAVLVVPSDDPSSTGRRISRSMTARLGAPVTVGAAGPVDDPADLPTAYAEALACARALLRLDRAGAAATAADLGYAGLLLGDGASAARFVARTLGPVIEHDEQRSTALLATVETYFATGQSLAASAKRLHVHPNTVNQRLDRVRRLLGVDWNDPDQALEVQLALRLRRLCHELGG